MIDPNDITRFNRTEYELHELLAFSVLVAGKKASTVAPQLQQLLHDLYAEYNGRGLLKTRMYPLDLFAWYSQSGLAARLKKAGIGCHGQKSRTLLELGTLTRERRIDLPRREHHRRRRRKSMGVLGEHLGRRVDRRCQQHLADHDGGHDACLQEHRAHDDLRQ